MYHFPCSRWLARDEEDGEIVVELMAEDYEDLEGMEKESDGWGGSKRSFSSVF